MIGQVPERSSEPDRVVNEISLPDQLKKFDAEFSTLNKTVHIEKALAKANNLIVSTKEEGLKTIRSPTLVTSEGKREIHIPEEFLKDYDQWPVAVLVKASSVLGLKVVTYKDEKFKFKQPAGDTDRAWQGLLLSITETNPWRC